MTLSLYHDIYECQGDHCLGDLVLLHGWGMNSHVWDAVMPGLLRRHRVTVIDMPGMGRSPLPSGKLQIENLAARMLEVAPAHALWVGWSLGAIIAASAASLAPERVSALVTVAANPRFTALEDWPDAMSEVLLQEFRDWLEEDSQGTLIRFLALQCKGSESMRDDLRFLRERVFHDGLPAHRALREGLGLLASTDARELYSRLGMPHLALFGSNDPLVPAQAVASVEALNPRIRTGLIAGAAHLPFVSHPDLFLQALEDFQDAR
jgi:pimeloyl-[acyl-carrier protein] methyl ester esterase